MPDNTYVIENKPAILVDEDYFNSIQRDSHVLEILECNGLRDWPAYDEAIAEYNEEQDNAM